MSKLRELIESANKQFDKTKSNLEEKEEDGTVSDLGIVPTGHKERED